MITINEGNVRVISCLTECVLLLAICTSLFGSAVHSDSDIKVLHSINVNKAGTYTLQNWAASSAAN